MLKVDMHIFIMVSNTYVTHVQDISVILQLKQLTIPVNVRIQKKNNTSLITPTRFTQVKNNPQCHQIHFTILPNVKLIVHIFQCAMIIPF